MGHRDCDSDMNSGSTTGIRFEQQTGGLDCREGVQREEGRKFRIFSKDTDSGCRDGVPSSKFTNQAA